MRLPEIDTPKQQPPLSIVEDKKPSGEQVESHLFLYENTQTVDLLTKIRISGSDVDRDLLQIYEHSALPNARNICPGTSSLSSPLRSTRNAPHLTLMQGEVLHALESATRTSAVPAVLQSTFLRQ